MSGNSRPCIFFGYLVLRLNEACTKDLLFGCEDLSYLLLSCIQISPVTSHNQRTLFSTHSVPTPQSLNICETKTAGHVVVVYQNTATEEFLFQTSFFFVGCVLRLMNGTLLL
jgi:hypothetical protein